MINVDDELLCIDNEYPRVFGLYASRSETVSSFV